jgi:hypothetical protein
VNGEDFWQRHAIQDFAPILNATSVRLSITLYPQAYYNIIEVSFDKCIFDHILHSDACERAFISSKVARRSAAAFPPRSGGQLSRSSP